MKSYFRCLLVLKFFVFASCIVEGLEVLSLEKPTSQSGTKLFTVYGNTATGDSSKAVDEAGGVTCSFSEQRHFSWWIVDLQDVFLIQQIGIIPPPEDALPRVRLNDFAIDVSMYLNGTSGDMVTPRLCHHQLPSLPYDGVSMFPCHASVMGRYVRISKNRVDPKSIYLCNVDVYGWKTQRAYSLESRKDKMSTNQVIRHVAASDTLTCFHWCTYERECTSFNLAEEGVCETIADPPGDVYAREAHKTGWTRYIVHNYS